MWHVCVWSDRKQGTIAHWNLVLLVRLVVSIALICVWEFHWKSLIKNQKFCCSIFFARQFIEIDFIFLSSILSQMISSVLETYNHFDNVHNSFDRWLLNNGCCLWYFNTPILPFEFTNGRYDYIQCFLFPINFLHGIFRERNWTVKKSNDKTILINQSVYSI